MINQENELELEFTSMADSEIESELDYVTSQIDDITRQLEDRPISEDMPGSESARWRNKAGIARRLFNKKKDALQIEAMKRGLNDLLLTKEQRIALAYRNAKQELHVASFLHIEKKKEEARRENYERHQISMREGAERRQSKLERRMARYDLFMNSLYNLMDRSEIEKIWDHAKMNNLNHPAFSEKDKDRE